MITQIVAGMGKSQRTFYGFVRQVAVFIHHRLNIIDTDIAQRHFAETGTDIFVQVYLSREKPESEHKNPLGSTVCKSQGDKH